MQPTFRKYEWRNLKNRTRLIKILRNLLAYQPLLINITTMSQISFWLMVNLLINRRLVFCWKHCFWFCSKYLLRLLGTLPTKVTSRVQNKFGATCISLMGNISAYKTVFYSFNVLKLFINMLTLNIVPLNIISGFMMSLLRKIPYNFSELFLTLKKGSVILAGTLLISAVTYCDNDISVYHRYHSYLRMSLTHMIR